MSQNLLYINISVTEILVDKLIKVNQDYFSKTVAQNQKWRNYGIFVEWTLSQWLLINQDKQLAYGIWRRPEQIGYWIRSLCVPKTVMKKVWHMCGIDIVSQWLLIRQHQRLAYGILSLRTVTPGQPNRNYWFKERKSLKATLKWIDYPKNKPVMLIGSLEDSSPLGTTLPPSVLHCSHLCFLTLFRTSDCYFLWPLTDLKV